MADKRISELNTITGANTADGDLFVIVDVDASETKKITLGELEKALGERDFSFADDDKLVFGDGDDLQIYHDSATSTNKVVGSIDVTGTVTADGLTVDGLVKIQGTATGLIFNETDTTDLNGYIINNNGDLNFMTVNDAFTSFNTRLQIDHSTGDISFYDTSGNPAFFWDASEERLGIGTTSPQRNITVFDAADSRMEIRTGTTTNLTALDFSDSANTARGKVTYDHSDDSLSFDTLSEERMRIDSSGNLQNADYAENSGATNGWILRQGGSTGAGTFESVVSATSARDHITIRNGATSGNASGNEVGAIGSSGTSLTVSTAGSEAARIDSSGNLFVGKFSRNFNTAGIDLNVQSDPHFVRNGTVCSFNRLGSDGTLINLAQGGAVEGSINVSGSTVSYNGGHLARWSRLADDSKDTSIVKGTVMTNLDEMVVWSHDAVDEALDEDGNVVTEAKEAYTEDNEQLNKMVASSVEGDPNVAGVFVNWDDDDDFNDMNIAMTGDMVIRIAQGTTVQRGDLLMSAGDGTAKPQGDDIVRSKTIAKVTSTHVSHTYDDGSYLVPCVLMAC